VNDIPTWSDASGRVAHELIQLEHRAEEARGTLSQLLLDMSLAENSLDSGQFSHLIEANERLVFAVVRAQADAQTVAEELSEVLRCADLDRLTELPNRGLMLDRFAAAIDSATLRQSRFALLFIDLNHFKKINDTWGHAVGDQVLKVTAQRLKSAAGDADTVSRLGGDEFLILVADAEDAIQVARKVVSELAVPRQFGEHVLNLSAGIGISIFPDDGKDADTLIDHADAAMYFAKRHGLDYVVHGDAPADSAGSCLPIDASPGKPMVNYELVLMEHERRHAQLREANEQLLMTALSAQLLQGATEKANRRQTEFLALLAHEIRTPLTPIRVAATLLGEVSPDELPGLQAVIERQVVHIARLVSDLFDVSRVHTGKLRLVCKMVDLVELVGEAVEMCRASIDSRQQELGISMPRRKLSIDGDHVRLTQVFVNLLDNASKYTPQGGKIELSMVVVDTHVMITVADEGIGISAEALPGIFEPFIQEARAIAYNGDGLGLGLAVVGELVKAHAGHVVVKSEGDGLGSQFIVTLPLCEHT
jgi:diguanylate cyclase (GGDEF)-like protein